jgi:hypothetical protein
MKRKANEKSKNLLTEIKRMWNLKVKVIPIIIVATGSLSRPFQKHLDDVIGKLVKFQVLTVVSMKMATFWVVAPCSLVEAHRRFRGASTRLYGATTQKTAVFIGKLFNVEQQMRIFLGTSS